MLNNHIETDYRKEDYSEEELKVIDRLESIEIEVPESLEQFVDGTLQRLPKRKLSVIKVASRIAASLVFLIFGLSILIYSNESFAAVAKGIPVISMLADMITSDMGTEQALLNGYPVKDTIVIVDGEYTLTIENLMIDEERISFQSTLEGPHFEKITNEGDWLDEPILEGEWVEDRVDFYSYSVSLVSDPFIPTHGSSYQDQGRTIESINFAEEKSAYIDTLLKNGEDLVLSCVVGRYIYATESTEIVHTFDNIHIPISEEDILRTIHIELNQSFDFKEGKITLNEMTISPTKMQLKGEDIPIDGIEAVGLHEVEWINAKGELLGVPSISKVGGGQGYVSYQSVPSVYFDPLREVTFRFKSYYYTLEHELYTLNLEGEFPQQFDYYGYQFEILDASIEKDELVILYDKDNYIDFEFEGIEILGLERSGSSISVFDSGETSYKEYRNYFDFDTTQKEFDFKLSGAKIIVETFGEVDVEVD